MVRVSSDIPMIGTRYFGVVDQGTNVIEVRPTSMCPLNCVFCSVAAGPKERRRWAEFVVDVEPLVEAVKALARVKGPGLEVHIDGMGEPATYPHLVELVQAIREIPEVRVVSMQSRLFLLNERRLEELAEAGLDRINMSIDAVDPGLARRLADSDDYDVVRAMELAEYAVRNTEMDVVASPVWLPGLNDGEIPKIVRWSVSTLGKRWPPVLIQKYIPHKRGRRPKRVKVVDWGEFWRQIKRWEAELGVKLDYRGENPFGFERRLEAPRVYRAGDVVKVRIVARGIFRGEYLAVPVRLSGDPLRDRALTVVGDVDVGDVVRVRIIEDRHNIYLAKPLND